MQKYPLIYVLQNLEKIDLNFYDNESYPLTYLTILESIIIIQLIYVGIHN